jgi:hypothetical protein
MSFLQLNITTTRALDLTNSRGDDVLLNIRNALVSTAAGTGPFSGWSVLNNVTALTSGSLSRAGGGILLASATGTIASVINGTSVDVSAGGSDAASALLAVAAINANTTVNPFVSASSYYGTLALSTVVAGTTINVCGYTFLATASATGLPNQFSISGNDAADALALAACINATPELNQKVFATTASATVYVVLQENRAARSNETMSASAGTVTVVQFAAGDAYFIIARQPGPLGNCCTLTATAGGGTATVITTVSGKLGGATGGYVSTGQYITSDMK